MFQKRSARSLAHLHEALVRWQQLVASSREVAAKVQPTLSGWSIAQHADHIARATHHNLRAARRLLDLGSPTAPGQSGTPPAAARPTASVLVTGRPTRMGRWILWCGRIPRGRAQAPAAVTPAELPSVLALEEAFATLLATTEALRPRAACLDTQLQRIAHPVLGPFTARQWLRFAAIHARHHLAIALEIRGELSTH